MSSYFGDLQPSVAELFKMAGYNDELIDDYTQRRKLGLFDEIPDHPEIEILRPLVYITDYRFHLSRFHALDFDSQKSVTEECLKVMNMSFDFDEVIGDEVSANVTSTLRTAMIERLRLVGTPAELNELLNSRIRNRYPSSVKIDFISTDLCNQVIRDGGAEWQGDRLGEHIVFGNPYFATYAVRWRDVYTREFQIVLKGMDEVSLDAVLESIKVTQLP